MQFNYQPIEKAVKSDGSVLDVHSIFHTIQGEGPFCGTPCVFVRLAGCNLQCPLCDTEYTQGRHPMTPLEILAEVNELVRADKWRRYLVVITGGEPFRQNLFELFRVLVNAQYYVQVESNGTLPPPVLFGTSLHQYNRDTSKRFGVYVVCSPKAGKVNPQIWANACCAKYVAKSGDIAEDGLPIHALDHTVNGVVARPPAEFALPVYLQPADERDEAANAANIVAVRESCMKHGYILQLQIHKLIGVE